MCALEVVPSFNAYLQLTAMPDDRFKVSIWSVSWPGAVDTC